MQADNVIRVINQHLPPDHPPIKITSKQVSNVMTCLRASHEIDFNVRFVYLIKLTTRKSSKFFMDVGTNLNGVRKSSGNHLGRRASSSTFLPVETS